MPSSQGQRPVNRIAYLTRLILQGESAKAATSAENEKALNAVEGAGGEQARIHAAEALHRLGRV